MREVDLLNKPVEQLMWTAPVEREDGTAFDASTEVGEYRVYYGTSSGDTSSVISVAGNTLYTTLDFTTLPLPLHVVMTTVDNEGRESTYSEELVFARKVYAPKPPTGLTV